MSHTALPHQLALQIASAWSLLEYRLTRSLSIRGVSFAEYRLLEALGQAHACRAARVELASAVGLTPSAITRALKPLEKIGIVATERDERDARLALAALTPAGKELLSDCTGLVNDEMLVLLARSPKKSPTVADCLQVLIDGQV